MAREANPANNKRDAAGSGTCSSPMLAVARNGIAIIWLPGINAVMVEMTPP
jgi:hypothetical protein